MPYRPGHLHLLDQFRDQAGWQNHESVLTAFGAPDTNSPPLQVDVLDAEVERFGDPQTAAVE